MAKQVIWTITAFKDLQNIVDFISNDSLYYALTFYDEVMEKANTLHEFPHRGRIVPEMDNPNVRELFVHRYRMIYHILEESIIINTIVHGARDYKND
jgi:toxin ParE1/3/4